MLIGYARVSTEDQNLDLQRDALRNAGCKRIFEKESGRAGTKRPAIEGTFSQAMRTCRGLAGRHPARARHSAFVRLMAYPD